MKVDLIQQFNFLQKISSVSEPVDYEQYLIRNKASITNDPYRDLVLFPSDDVKVRPFPVFLFKSV